MIAMSNQQVEGDLVKSRKLAVVIAATLVFSGIGVTPALAKTAETGTLKITVGRTR